MSITTILGTHVLSNSWMNSDGNPATNAPGHAGLSQVDIFDIAADAGSDIVRLPLSLRDAVRNADGSYTLPTWQITSVIQPILQDAADRAAAGRPVKIIMELGETPAGVAANDFATIAGASRAFVDAVYTALPGLTSHIAAWEIGNEPNEIHIGLYRNKPLDFADYVAAVANAVTPLEAKHGTPIDIVVGAIAYNDYDYMAAVIDRLEGNRNIDGFALHPYTFSPQQAQIDGPASSPDYRSKRPTDWTTASGPQDDNDFQGAIYNLQQLMNANGFAGKGLWITEVGVPSWLGFRNSGPDGRDDQGRWTAEALGVFEAWDNANLEAVVIHSTVDFQTGVYNDAFDIFDGNPANNNDGSDGEGSFGLFERYYDGGPVTAKAAAYVFAAYQGDFAPSAALFPEGVSAALARMRIVIGTDLAATTDLSARNGGDGLTNGWIALGKGGADSIIGSAFDDSLFGGDGNDTVRGGSGGDRIYGGSGNDTLQGETGNDDLYGNTGDDAINAGTGWNRVNGGTGRDTLVLQGRAADYQISGDGGHLVVDGLGETTNAYDVERVYFIGDAAERALANADETRGNGFGSSTPPGPQETLYQDVAATQWLTGQSSADVFVIGASSANYHAGQTLDGSGIVVWNGAKFDILTGFETIRFSDKDVTADAAGRFLVTPGDAANYPGSGEALHYDTAATQWVTGTSGNDVFVYATSSAGFQAGPTVDGTGIVVWNGAKFDILTGFETLRFSDKDVTAGANGQFVIGGGAGQTETVVLDNPFATQHLTGGSGLDVFELDGGAADFGVARTQDGTGVVVWKGAAFDVLHGFETIRFDDRDVQTSDLL